MTAPSRVTLDVFGVDTAHVPAALLAMARDRSLLRRIPGLTFAKLLGTGSGRTFTATDADVHHWALLACWAQAADAAAFPHSRSAQGWLARSHEHLHVELTPLTSHGSWSGRDPFGPVDARRWDGPVAAITRARLRPSRAVTFWRAAPPVAVALRHHDGMRFSLGIGEAPVGLQGTFSLWRDQAALRAFAYHDDVHVQVIERTRTLGWYSEELFARFGVVDVRGTFDGEGITW
jgi:hypothetical protein